MGRVKGRGMQRSREKKVTKAKFETGTSWNEIAGLLCICTPWYVYVCGSCHGVSYCQHSEGVTMETKTQIGLTENENENELPNYNE